MFIFVIMLSEVNQLFLEEGVVFKLPYGVFQVLALENDRVKQGKVVAAVPISLVLQDITQS